METLTLKDILDLGATGMLIVAVLGLWRAYNKLTERLFNYLEQARLERHQMRNQLQALNMDKWQAPPAPRDE